MSRRARCRRPRLLRYLAACPPLCSATVGAANCSAAFHLSLKQRLRPPESPWLTGGEHCTAMLAPREALLSPALPFHRRRGEMQLPRSYYCHARCELLIARTHTHTDISRGMHSPIPSANGRAGGCIARNLSAPVACDSGAATRPFCPPHAHPFVAAPAQTASLSRGLFSTAAPCLAADHHLGCRDAPTQGALIAQSRRI